MGEQGQGLFSDLRCNRNGPPVTSKPACQGNSGAGPSGKGTKQDTWAESAGAEGGDAEHYRQFNTRGKIKKDRDKRWLTFERRL